MFFLPILVGLRMYKIYLTICNRQKIKYEKKKEMFTASIPDPDPLSGELQDPDPH